MYGLELLFFLVKGVKVMLIMNFWLKIGFCNGVIGKVVYIVYQINYQLFDLFIVVIVKFDNYIGLFISDIILVCVFICFIIVVVQLVDVLYERQ